MSSFDYLIDSQPALLAHEAEDAAGDDEVGFQRSQQIAARRSFPHDFVRTRQIQSRTDFFDALPRLV
jgi:hypothetical protein